MKNSQKKCLICTIPQYKVYIYDAYMYEVSVINSKMKGKNFPRIAASP